MSGARRHCSLVPVLLTLALAAGCAHKRYDPFKVPEAELRRRVDTIALAPLKVSFDLADPATARAAIEPVVATTLQRAGFRVVRSAEFDGLWRRAAGAVGDVYDGKTGKVNKQRREAVQNSVFRDLAKRHGADAVLYMSITEEEFPLPTQPLWFCGTEGQPYWPGGLAGHERATLAYAACLNVQLVDMGDRSLYVIRSGLRGTQTFAFQTWAQRPRAQLLGPATIQNAVAATLGRLAGP